MKRKGLIQPPYAATLMGCLKGVFDYYGLKYSPAMLYGLTGHAFFINIHKEICPSGPYVWDHTFQNKLTEKLGVKMSESPLITKETSGEIRREAVERLSFFLEGGNPCMITSLEHQLVEEIRGEEITLLRPWKEEVESQFHSLDSKDFSPCLDRAGFLMFGYFEKTPVKPDLSKAIRRALLMAKDLFEKPEKYQKEGYRSGFGAYENWISALQKDQFNEQGHWWNGMVWAECRERGAEFFEELIPLESNMDKEILRSLASVYRVIFERLSETKEKELDREKKIILLTEALEMEYEAEYFLDQLLNP